MLKHILTTTPGNGSVSNLGRNMAGAGSGAGASGSAATTTPRPDSAADRIERDLSSKLDDKISSRDTRDGISGRLDLSRIDSRDLNGNRADGYGPRTDARGDVRERSDRQEHLYRDTSLSGRLDYSHGEDKIGETRNDTSSRNVLINKLEYHSRELPTNVSNRDFRSDYRADLSAREHANKMEQYGHHRYQNTGINRIRDPNHCQLSVNSVQRLPQHQPLNISTLNSSKHSLGGTSSSASPGGRGHKYPNGGLNISRVATNGRSNGVVAGLSLTPASLVPANVSRFMNKSKEVGIKEMLTSLGLLCLVSLLLALLSLIFLLKISPVTSTDIRELLRAEQLSVISAEEYVVVYEVTLALCALTLSLNLCCLLVCAVQFLFAVKLVNSFNGGGGRTNKYLQKSAVTRVCAVGGFFISIPVFLTGIILYTFIQFHSTPAIVTSVFIGLGIIFCGCAMVHNVFIWQKEKTNAVKALHSQSQVIDQPLMNSTQNIGSPQAMANGYLTNGHIPSGVNTTHGTNMSFHNTTAGTTYTSHHPITVLPHQGPYIIRPPTTTPPTPGEVCGVTRSTRPPRPPAPSSASPTIPQATLDLSHTLNTDPHELSTLV